MSIFNIKRYMSPSSPEKQIQKLQDEIKEIELRTYQKKLEQKKKKLLEEENEIKNGDLATFNEREAEKNEIYKSMLGAILAYTLLTLFMFSTCFIILKLRKHGCHGSDFAPDILAGTQKQPPNPTPILIPLPEPSDPPTQELLDIAPATIVPLWYTNPSDNDNANDDADPLKRELQDEYEYVEDPGDYPAFYFPYATPEPATTVEYPPTIAELADIPNTAQEDPHTIAELADIPNTAPEEEVTTGGVNFCKQYLLNQFHEDSAIVTLHNLTFGLVSAVVVSQIGSRQNKQTNQLLHATKSASGFGSIALRLVYTFITWTPRIYILMWILTGCACLLCGAIWGSEYSGPLYITGQAWLGIAITTVYLFFGLKETTKENNDDTKKEKDDGEEKDDDDDEEEGALCHKGTKSNYKRNDDDDDDISLPQNVILQDDIPV